MNDDFLTDPTRACNPDTIDPANTRLFTSDQRWETREAKTICAGCPVQPACLQYALDHDEQHYVWGGFLMSSPEERRAARAGEQPKTRRPAAPSRKTVDLVADMWQQGMSDAAMARQLGLNRCTVRDHRHNLGLPALFGGHGKRLQAVA